MIRICSGLLKLFATPVPKPFSLTVGSSRQHRALLAAVYGVAFGLLLLLDLSPLADAVTFALLTALAVRDPVWRQRDRVLSWRNGGWSWSVDGAVVPVELLSWRIFAGVTLLNLRFIIGPNSNKKMTLVLFPDSASADSLKRLRRILFADNNILSGKV